MNGRALIEISTATEGLQLRNILRREGIWARMVRAPRGFSASGCTQAVEIPHGDTALAAEILAGQGYAQAKIKIT
ncbi:MAG: DUF3343 domain-containing protein [Clostridia bacterium]|nr:DUF3343 domain-containing protein [Clostridia bacterium]